MRDAAQEVSLYRGALPQASSASLAAQLLGKMTWATQAAIRAEHKLIVQEALNGMGALDREVLVLRHFEHLSNTRPRWCWASRNRPPVSATSGR
jgi:RNA polymerase sigma-70 factor (ECF subfamily)